MVRSDTGVKSCCGHRLFAHWARSHSRDLGFSRLAFSRLPRSCLSREPRSPAPNAEFLNLAGNGHRKRQNQADEFWDLVMGDLAAAVVAELLFTGRHAGLQPDPCTDGLAEQRMRNAHDLHTLSRSCSHTGGGSDHPDSRHSLALLILHSARASRSRLHGNAASRVRLMAASAALGLALPLTAAMRTMPYNSVQPRRRKPCVCSGLPWSSRCARQR